MDVDLLCNILSLDPYFFSKVFLDVKEYVQLFAPRFLASKFSISIDCSAS